MMQMIRINAKPCTTAGTLTVIT